MKMKTLIIALLVAGLGAVSGYAQTRTNAELGGISRTASTNLTTDPASIQVVKDLLAALKSEAAATNLNQATREAYTFAIQHVQGIVDGEGFAPIPSSGLWGDYYWLGYANVVSWALFVKDNNYVNSSILTNVNRFDALIVVHPVVKVTNAATAKKLVIHGLGIQLVYRNGNLASVIDPAKRLEIIERRTAGLSVVGPDALPKTKALTTAINTGNGLLEALQAFIGNDLPNLGAALAKKIADVQAQKEQFNSGLKDPTPGDIAIIGSWLGIEPTAAWIKQYNGQ